MSKHTQVKAQNDKGSVQLTQHETDSPILPVPQLEQLHAFRPDLVDWVKEQTEKEAAFRRTRTETVDRYVLIERIGGLAAGFILSLFGLSVAAYLGLHGQPWLAGTLGGGTLVSIVAILVQGRSKKSQNGSAGSA